MGRPSAMRYSGWLSGLHGDFPILHFPRSDGNRLCRTIHCRSIFSICTCVQTCTEGETNLLPLATTKLSMIARRVVRVWAHYSCADLSPQLDSQTWDSVGLGVNMTRWPCKSLIATESVRRCNISEDGLADVELCQHLMVHELKIRRPGSVHFVLESRVISQHGHVK